MVHTGAADIANVVAVSGSAEALALLELNALTGIDASADLRWQYGTGPQAQTRSGHDFLLDPGPEVGTRYLTLTDPDDRVRRVRVEVLAEGSLLIGGRGRCARRDRSAGRRPRLSTAPTG